MSLLLPGIRSHSKKAIQNSAALSPHASQNHATMSLASTIGGGSASNASFGDLQNSTQHGNLGSWNELSDGSVSLSEQDVCIQGCQVAISTRRKSESGLRRSDFQVVATLGHGAAGRVSLVYSKHYGRRFYAMKAMDKWQILEKRNAGLDPKAVHRASAERNAHIVCGSKDTFDRCPFIVEFVCSFQSTKKLYYLFEFCAGGELYELIRLRGHLEENLAKFYLSEICLAVAYIHSKGILHRDLKAENILIHDDGHIRVTDFGSCKLIHESESEDASDINYGHAFRNRGQSTLGFSHSIMPPEFFSCNMHGEAMDWFQVGVLAYQMLCGCRPWKDNQESTRMYPVMWPESLNISEAAKLFVNALLHPDDFKRLSCLADVKSHIFFNDIDWASVSTKNSPAPYMSGAINAAQPCTELLATLRCTSDDVDMTGLLEEEVGSALASSNYDIYDPLPLRSFSFAGSLDRLASAGISIDDFEVALEAANPFATSRT